MIEWLGDRVLGDRVITSDRVLGDLEWLGDRVLTISLTAFVRCERSLGDRSPLGAGSLVVRCRVDRLATGC